MVWGPPGGGDIQTESRVEVRASVADLGKEYSRCRKQCEVHGLSVLGAAWMWCRWWVVSKGSVGEIPGRRGASWPLPHPCLGLEGRPTASRLATETLVRSAWLRAPHCSALGQPGALCSQPGWG